MPTQVVFKIKGDKVFIENETVEVDPFQDAEIQDIIYNGLGIPEEYRGGGYSVLVKMDNYLIKNYKGQ